MAENPGTLEGWYALHDLRSFDWAAWKALTTSERASILAEAKQYLTRAQDASDTGEGSSALFSMIGHKSSIMLLHLRPTIDQLNALEVAFNKTRLADFTSRSYSYLSVTELSLYEAAARGGQVDNVDELMKSPFVQKRLKPVIPDYPYVCFYPMNKKRGEVNNWYAADLEERRLMMRQHGSTGRKFAEQVQQMITGSFGMDDWEWGVTLFSKDALAVKKLVHEMRFDEVTAKYAEFGPFQMGLRQKPDQLDTFFAV